MNGRSGVAGEGDDVATRVGREAGAVDRDGAADGAACGGDGRDDQGGGGDGQAVFIRCRAIRVLDFKDQGRGCGGIGGGDGDLELLVVDEVGGERGRGGGNALMP